MAQMFHFTVDQIAGEGDEIGGQRLDFGYDLLEKIPLDGETDVNIADLGDAEAFHRGRKAANGDGYLKDSQAAAGGVQAVAGQPGRQANDAQIEGIEQKQASIGCGRKKG